MDWSETDWGLYIEFSIEGMRHTLILLLMRLIDRPLGITQMQKLAFLAQHYNGVSITSDFVAHKFGPWSASVQQYAEVACHQGLLDFSYDMNGNKKYWVSKQGEDKIQDAEISCDNYESLLDIARTIGDLPTRQLIKFVYQQFPEWTHNSTIKDRIDTLPSAQWNQGFAPANELFTTDEGCVVPESPRGEWVEERSHNHDHHENERILGSDLFSAFIAEKLSNAHEVLGEAMTSCLVPVVMSLQGLLGLMFKMLGGLMGSDPGIAQIENMTTMLLQIKAMVAPTGVSPNAAILEWVEDMLDFFTEYQGN